MKRTPIKSSTKPLKRTKLKRVSNKQSLALKIYSDLRKQYLAAHPICGCQHNFIQTGSVYGSSVMQCKNPSSQIHHMKRRGKYLNDPFTWMAICEKHHTMIEQNANAARSFGLILK